MESQQAKNFQELLKSLFNLAFLIYAPGLPVMFLAHESGVNTRSIIILYVIIINPLLAKIITQIKDFLKSNYVYSRLEGMIS